MREQARIFLVEVEGGHALPDAIRLHAGRVLPRTSIGQKGRWYVAGVGVRELHAEIMFDGADLHVRSTSPEHPLKIEGNPLSFGWTRVRAPSRISMGSVTLAFVLLPAEEEVQVDGALGATRIDAASADPSSTQIDVAGADLSATRIDIGCTDLSATRIDIAPLPPSVVSAARFPIDIPPEPPAPRKETPQRFESLKREWRRASLLRKTILVLLPLAFLTIHVMAKNRERQAAWRSRFDAIAASSAITASSPAGNAAVPEPSGLPLASTAPPSVVPSAGKTLDRLAAEAVANNAYSQAVTRYEALSQQHPDQAAYREAARILRSKLVDASAP